MQPLLTPEQLAERLSLHPETVRRLTREKKIAHLTVGGVYRYDWSAVQQALQPHFPAVLVPLDLLARIIQHADDPKKQMAPGVGAPGHSHRVPGKWDENGTPCQICADWDALRALLGVSQ